MNKALSWLLMMQLCGYALVGAADRQTADDGARRMKRDRIKAILHSGETKSDEGRRSLEDTLENDKESSYREASAVALGKMRNKKSIPKLKQRLKDENVNVRMRAAWALARMGDKSGKALALETIKGDDITGQLLAAEALGSVGDKDAIPTLKENLKNERVTVRWHSKVAIKNIEMAGLSDPGKVGYLGKILGSNEMNNWAAVELTKIGSPEAINALRKAAEDPNNRGSYAAQKALNRLKEMGKLP